MTPQRPGGIRRALSWRPRTPAAALILLAPIVGEVLNGATRLSYIFSFVPQIMVWGCGTLLIREIVHRWKSGWIGIVLLGLALAIWAEVIVLQTSVAPIPWIVIMSIPDYGRVWGVGWVWFIYMLGYELVWIVLVPILITELVFPDRRGDAWLTRRGLTAAAVTFLAGSALLWVLWTRIAVPFAFNQPVFSPPVLTLVLGLLCIVLLAVAAYATRRWPVSSPVAARRVAPPWLVVVIAMALGFPWWILIVLVFAPQMSLPLWIPLLGGALWALIAFLTIRWFTISSGWTDRHRWALAFGALLVCMLAGYLGSSFWPVIDLIGKIVLNVLAVIWMIWLAGQIRVREPSTTSTT